MIGSHLAKRFAVLALGALSACSYDAADIGPMFEMNTCSIDMDCGEGAACREGMCVAQSADSTLTLALQVTPVRMPDGSDPIPLVLERFPVDGPLDRTFTLPTPVIVEGDVRNAGMPIDAEIRFTPMDVPSGFAARVITATASADAPPDAATFRVQLLEGVEYRVAIRPGDRSLPPYTQSLRAGSQALSIDFAELSEAQERTFTITGGPEGRALLVRAFDLETSEALSSTATVTDGEAVLRFASDPPPLRLEIRADQSYPATAMLQDARCDAETPDFPVFSVTEDELEITSDGSRLIELPQAPQRIRFEGRVSMCSAVPTNVVATESLPITLHARSLNLPDGSQLRATYEATTTATLDSATGELRFCVEVMPGEYDLLATPASTIPCAIFAERRFIEAPDGEHASGALLRLPLAAHLRGTLQTADQTPMRGATIDAVALGRELDESDSVTRYNRSRQTTSAQNGTFEMAVDLGSYDVVVKPPAGSGFPWQVRHDVDIAARAVPFATIIDMLSPVAVDGRLRYLDGSGRFEGAEVVAFAIVADARVPGAERALPIGKATADRDGRFRLLLPPSIHKGW